MISFLILLAVLIGASATIQGTVNGGLATRLGVGTTILINSAVALAGAFLWWMIASSPERGADPRPISWILYTGGLWGLILILCAAFAFPRLGAGPTTAIAVAAQLIVALVIDHYGFSGERLAVTPWRILGGLLLVAGATLVLWPRLSATGP